MVVGMSLPKPPDQSESDWLTPAEAAAIFRVTPRTLARAADRGDLVVTRTPGGRRRYLRQSLLQLLDQAQAS